MPLSVLWWLVPLLVGMAAAATILYVIWSQDDD